METDHANAAKADFASIYERPTPHAYYRHLGELDYGICDEMRPFCAAVARRLRRESGRVRLLDVGCSYGINAATVRHGLTFAELNRLFELNVDEAPARAAGQVRAAFDRADEACAVEAGGLDVSGPAVNFALDADILQHGIVADLEADAAELSRGDRSWLADVNLLLCTGAIGYVTERTFRVVLDAMADGAVNAIALLTVLRVFDHAPIAAVLREHGLACEVVPDVLLPQRRFQDETEQEEIVRVIESRGLDATPERAGRHFARLLVAARADRLPDVLAELRGVAASRPTLAAAPPPQVKPARPAGASPVGSRAPS